MIFVEIINSRKTKSIPAKCMMDDLGISYDAEDFCSRMAKIRVSALSTWLLLSGLVFFAESKMKENSVVCKIMPNAQDARIFCSLSAQCECMSVFVEPCLPHCCHSHQHFSLSLHKTFVMLADPLDFIERGRWYQDQAGNARLSYLFALPRRCHVPRLRCQSPS